MRARITPEPLPPPPEGIQVWENPGNKLTVCRVHYTADPEKRTTEWRQKAAEGYPAGRADPGWRREYEIAFDIPEGEPVFPEFDQARMVRQDLRALPGARPLRGWDFGHVCPVVLCGQLDPWGRLQILAEVVLRGAPLEALAEAANAMVFEHWGSPRPCFDAGDPAGEKETDLGMVRQILLNQFGIVLHTTGSWKRMASHMTLRSRLLDLTVAGSEGPSPKFLVHPRCVHLIKALAGGYHKSPKNPGQFVDCHPDKDVCDALRYLNDNLLGAQSDRQKELQRMSEVDRAW